MSKVIRISDDDLNLIESINICLVDLKIVKDLNTFSDKVVISTALSYYLRHLKSLKTEDGRSC